MTRIQEALLTWTTTGTRSFKRRGGEIQTRTWLSSELGALAASIRRRMPVAADRAFISPHVGGMASWGCRLCARVKRGRRSNEPSRCRQPYKQLTRIDLPYARENGSTSFQKKARTWKTSDSILDRSSALWSQAAPGPHRDRHIVAHVQL
jgi:hypothetical protein